MVVIITSIAVVLIGATITAISILSWEEHQRWLDRQVFLEDPRLEAKLKGRGKRVADLILRIFGGKR